MPKTIRRAVGTPKPRPARKAPVPKSEARVSIRHDLWKAFTVLDPRFPVRFYDKSTGKAELSQELPARKAVVRIQQITREEQKSWAEAFAKSLTESEARRKLQESFKDDAWTPNKFKNLMGKEEDLSTKWDSVRGRHVLERIDVWKKKHRLDLDPIQPPKTATFVEKSMGGYDVDLLRRRLIRAIERMPLHELVSLRVPAGYLIE